jgi:hypothetical protein
MPPEILLPGGAAHSTAMMAVTTRCCCGAVQLPPTSAPRAAPEAATTKCPDTLHRVQERATPVLGSSQVNVMFSSLSSGRLNAFLMASVNNL